MKRKHILGIQPIEPRTVSPVITWQQEGNLLILNRYTDRILQERYCIRLDTGEHEIWSAWSQVWNTRSCLTMGVLNLTKVEDEPELIATLESSPLYEKWYYDKSVKRMLYRIENHWNSKEYDKRMVRKEKRMEELMQSLPQRPAVEDYVYERIGSPDYAFYDEGTWFCTNCESQFEGKWKHNALLACPQCGKVITAKRLTRQIRHREQCYVLQTVNNDYSVERHYDIQYDWDLSGKSCTASVGKIIPLYKLGSGRYTPAKSKVYYNAIPRDRSMGYGGICRISDTNAGNRRSGKGYLWPDGIREALEGTHYARWTTLYTKMAAAGMKLDYNRLLCLEKPAGAERTLEMLWEGRFKRLIHEVADDVMYFDGLCRCALVLDGKTMEEVFGLSDRQKINRIRQRDGGLQMLSWLKYMEQTGEKANDETLTWLEQTGIMPNRVKKLNVPMSLTQIVNYLKKQEAGDYSGRPADTILEQWADYLDMAKTLGKDMTDEMVYRPRELKRRHDEYAEERRKNQDAWELKKNEGKRREAAAKLREQFPQAEAILAEIRDRYEFEDETYRIIVPHELLEIVTEGAALHHCAGSSNRYYERIENRETYICFLRKKSEPEEAFYTIEVEPGGTIRQHRGYLDEEPDIDEIRPFLREWQKEIRKRMKAEDHELARQSEILRKKNIEDLIAKGNVRVLRGLEEDFMEAVNG